MQLSADLQIYILIENRVPQDKDDFEFNRKTMDQNPADDVAQSEVKIN